ncbi:MAG: hypothetical protein RL033_1236 [Pseudomonadota bacterium]
MLTFKIPSIATVVCLSFVSSLAAAADDEVPAIPGEPPAGTPSALPSGPVPGPEPAPNAPPTDRVRDGDRYDDDVPSSMLNIDVEGASAYVWRGINLFGADQNTQNFSVFPSITATFGDFSLGYWGAFQLSGDNKSANVDGGVGGENDLILKVSGPLGDNVHASGSLTYWVYPFANLPGDETPMYLEPGAGISYLTGADLGLYIGYYRGLQSVTAPNSFLYINPSIGKTIPLDANLGLALGLSAGYKVFTEDPPVEDRQFDLALNAGIAIPFSDTYVTPQIHLAYVTRDEDVVPDAGFSDSFIAWVGVHVGYNIGL